MEQLKSMKTSRATASVKLVMPTRAQRARYDALKEKEREAQQARQAAFHAIPPQQQQQPAEKETAPATAKRRAVALPEQERAAKVRQEMNERRRRFLATLWQRQPQLVAKVKENVLEHVGKAPALGVHLCQRLFEKSMAVSSALYRHFFDQESKKK